MSAAPHSLPVQQDAPIHDHFYLDEKEGTPKGPPPQP